MVRASRILASTGLRLALVQAVLLIVVFSVAGALTRASVKLTYRHELQTRLLGEAAALSALDRTKGLAAVAQLMTQSEHRPDGLEYRLTDAAGRMRAGDLPPTGAGPGFTFLDWDDKAEPGRPFQDLIVYTSVLPDHAVLTVGQDLTGESQLRHALKKTLFWCGAIGGGLGLGLTFLFAYGPLWRVRGVVGAARAVSAGRMQVRAPERKAWLSDDIDELGHAFNTMLDEISTLVNRVRWVSTDIAHDLRTPLTRIRHKLDRIGQSPDTGVSAAAEEIEADIDELLRTFDAMLRLAEIENSAGAPTTTVDLGELAERVADAYRPDIEASGRTFELTGPPAQTTGEPDLIAQALSNLLENALRHTPPDAHIAVRVERVEGRPAISVIDDGAGIPASLRQTAVQRFRRLQPGRSGPGSGLGLAIASAIASRHGGALVLSDAGPGLKATLAFSAL